MSLLSQQCARVGGTLDPNSVVAQCVAPQNPVLDWTVFILILAAIGYWIISSKRIR